MASAKRAQRARAGQHRVFLTVTVAPHTEARVIVLAKLAGISRGQVVDLALDALDVCDTCQGAGRLEDPDALGSGLTRECYVCSGHRIVPRDRA